jgi:hypothetical protein
MPASSMCDLWSLYFLGYVQGQHSLGQYCMFHSRLFLLHAQVVLSPARLLYSIMGKETYVRLYNVLDAKLVGGIAGLGTQFGAAIFTGSACILGGIAAATASKIVYFR